MRIYGIHSGRNNMSKLIARSIMYNSPKKKSTQQHNTTNSDTSILVYIIAFIIIALLFCR